VVSKFSLKVSLLEQKLYTSQTANDGLKLENDNLILDKQQYEREFCIAQV
jgi:hypothetical protein